VHGVLLIQISEWDFEEAQSDSGKAPLNQISDKITFLQWRRVFWEVHQQKWKSNFSAWGDHLKHAFLDMCFERLQWEASTGNLKIFKLFWRQSHLDIIEDPLYENMITLLVSIKGCKEYGSAASLWNSKPEWTKKDEKSYCSLLSVDRLHLICKSIEILKLYLWIDV